MTFAYIHEFQTCFSQTSCLPSFPSFLYLSFISYLIGFNLLFKESTHSYIYIYISTWIESIVSNLYISHLISLLLHSIFFFNIVEISPFLLIQLFRRNFRYLENFNLDIPKIPILRKRIESRLKERTHACFSWRFEQMLKFFLENLYHVN